MRKSWTVPLILLVAGVAASMASAAPPTGDDALKPASLRLAATGEAALAKAQHDAAIDAFEAALAVDPRNRAAFTGIARAYQAQGLPGRAIRYYREALALDPNDLGALEGQGKALIARGATARAQVNLARIKALCKADCAAAKRLETALLAPPPPVTASVTPAKDAVAKN